jgi:hypothetical protein
MFRKPRIQSRCLIVCLPGFRQPLLVASRKLLACVGKPKKITCGSFYHHYMLMIKTVRGQRSVESWNMHRRVRVEMRDKLVPVTSHLFGEVRKIGFRHSQIDKKGSFKGGWVSDNVTPEVFVLFVAKQLAPFKHSYVETVVADLSPECRTCKRWRARIRTGLALSSAKVSDVPRETGAKDGDSAKTFAARQWLLPLSFE